MKTVLKKMYPTRFYGQNQKIWEKMAIFGQFPLYNWSNLKSAGTLPQLTQSFWNFLGGLISSTYTYSQLSNIFIKKNEIQHHLTVHHGDGHVSSSVYDQLSPYKSPQWTTPSRRRVDEIIYPHFNQFSDLKKIMINTWTLFCSLQHHRRCQDNLSSSGPDPVAY